MHNQSEEERLLRSEYRTKLQHELMQEVVSMKPVKGARLVVETEDEYVKRRRSGGVTYWHPLLKLHITDGVHSMPVKYTMVNNDLKKIVMEDRDLPRRITYRSLKGLMRKASELLERVEYNRIVRLRERKAEKARGIKFAEDLAADFPHLKDRFTLPRFSKSVAKLDVGNTRAHVTPKNAEGLYPVKFGPMCLSPEQALAIFNILDQPRKS